MRILRWINVVFVSIFVLTLWMCQSKNYSNKSHELQYKKENRKIEFYSRVFHLDQKLSRLYYRLNTDQLTYIKSDTADWYFANAKVSVKLLNDPNAKSFIDTFSFVIHDRQNTVSAKVIDSYSEFKYLFPSSYYLEIEVSDLHNRNAQRTEIVKSDKSSYFSPDFYFPTYENEAVSFHNHFTLGHKIKIQNVFDKQASLRVDFYAFDYTLPPPPFSMKESAAVPEKADSSFYLMKSDQQVSLYLNKRGLYFFTSDSLLQNGISLLADENEFPRITSHEQMIASTRYILSMDEFKRLMESKDKKRAIEEFWLGIAGNNARASELIRKFYGRVQDANRLFSCHLDGWRSDRGMIYIVFGAPHKVYKTEYGELWAYGNSGPGAIEFRFDKQKNKFSENHFLLQRSTAFKDPWYLAVNAWREGRVTSDN